MSAPRCVNRPGGAGVVYVVGRLGRAWAGRAMYV